MVNLADNGSKQGQLCSKKGAETWEKKEQDKSVFESCWT